MVNEQTLIIVGIVALGVVALLMLVYLTNVDAIRAGAFRAGLDAACANPKQVCQSQDSMFNFTNGTNGGIAWQNQS